MSASTSVVSTALDQAIAPTVRPPRINLRAFLPGLAALFAAFPLAFVIHLVTAALPSQPERAVNLVAVLLAAVVITPPAVYIWRRWRVLNPATLAFIVLVDIAVVLVAIYLYWVSFYVAFPADILIWSESDFVNDIIKFRVGYPLYTAQVNNESFTYVPGPQLLTYFLASLSGQATSIPVYRVIQVGYTILSAFVAMLSVRRILSLALPGRSEVGEARWSAVWLPVLFLIATNSLTNPFVHTLHDDALAQLFNVIAFYLLLVYVSGRDRRVLAVMALLPAVGFLIKQSLIIWAPFYVLELALFDRPRSLPRAISFAAVSFGAIGLVLGICYLIWGQPFFYWIFTVLGSHTVSPLRSFQHLLDVWIYFAIGLLGGYVLLRGSNWRALLGPWVIGIGLLTAETYTSGIAWMINHIGPGSLIAGIWFLAALTRVWPLILHVRKGERFAGGLRAGLATGALLLAFSGLNVIRVPIQPLPQDAYRYIADIEAQFSGRQSSSILLDIGSWVYVNGGVVMQDRAPGIGERGYSATGDFSGILERLREKKYSKILVRNLRGADLWYEDSHWPKESGIRQAMLDNYHEVGTIIAVQSSSYQPDPGYTFSTISILVPNSP